METSPYDFYLIQRLELPYRDEPDRGFDGLLKLDYMGSSEFEFGTPSDALKEMRALAPLSVVERDVTIDGVTRTVFFVGGTGVEALIDRFVAWAEGPEQRTKEAPYFVPQFLGAAAEYQSRCVAWWSFSEPLAWALEREHAERLLSAFLAVKAA